MKIIFLIINNNNNNNNDLNNNNEEIIILNDNKNIIPTIKYNLKNRSKIQINNSPSVINAFIIYESN